jgi:hypothetical protein
MVLIFSNKADSKRRGHLAAFPVALGNCVFP